MRYDPFTFDIFEGLDKEKYILAIYYSEAETSDLLMRSAALAVEQTTGTWQPVPEDTDTVKKVSGGRVIGVHEVPSYEDMVPPEVKTRKFIIIVAFPIININYQIPELITTLYGNISMLSRLKLLDVFLPKSFVSHFQGPKFGIAGIRKLLDVHGRPLLCGMIKPCVGISAKTAGKLVYEMAMGGIDIIKDDELLADPEFCSVEARLSECMKGIQKACKQTGKKTLYTINVTDTPSLMVKKALKVQKMGGNALMVNAYAVGYGALQELAENKQIELPILAHPAYAGSQFESPLYGLTSNLIFGKFLRLSGADMLIYPGPFGKVPLVKEKAVRVAHELTYPMYNLKKVLPGPAAGNYPGMVTEMMEYFGNDFLIGAGGGIHAHPDGVVAGVKAFYQAIKATLSHTPLRVAAESNRELKKALDKWGVFGEKSGTYDLTK